MQTEAQGPARCAHHRRWAVGSLELQPPCLAAGAALTRAGWGILSLRTTRRPHWGASSWAPGSELVPPAFSLPSSPASALLRLRACYRTLRPLQKAKPKKVTFLTQSQSSCRLQCLPRTRTARPKLRSLARRLPAPCRRPCPRHSVPWPAGAAPRPPPGMLFHWPGGPVTPHVTLTCSVAIKAQLQCHLFREAFLIPQRRRWDRTLREWRLGDVSCRESGLHAALPSLPPSLGAPCSYRTQRPWAPSPCSPMSLHLGGSDQREQRTL